MKLSISNIPEGGARFDFARKGAWLEGILPDDKREDFRLREVYVDGLARKVRDTIRIEMAMEIVLEMACGRCLEPVVVPLKSNVTYTLAPLKERMEGEDPESLEDDLEFSYYQGDEIEIDPLVVDQVIMQIPVKPLCSEDCKGLCPNCGANLNIDKGCSCRPENRAHCLCGIEELCRSQINRFKYTGR